MHSLRCPDRVTTPLRWLSLAAFAGYIGWNAYWLALARLPPSLWSFATGLPCPSSGLTRSVQSLWAGDYAGFILYNPFTIPFVLLFAGSLVWISTRWTLGRSPALPRPLVLAWLLTILGAFLAKFLIGPAYW